LRNFLQDKERVFQNNYNFSLSKTKINMTDFNQFHDSFNADSQAQTKKLPDMLNILTILTFIGCAIGLLSSIYNYFAVCKSVEMMAKLTEDGDNPMASMMSSMSEAMVKQCELKLPILIIMLASMALCFLGALQMRKLKRTGFFLYLLGQVVAPVAMIVMGAAGGGILAIIGYIFPVIFLVLYATQLKHLK